MSRKYQLKVRAQRQEETRRRIVDAALELHRTVGPARTGVSAIAARARVQRHTFYRYFPDELTLLKACSKRGFSLDPPPDPRGWLDISDPWVRLRSGLAEAYAYYRRNEGLMSNVLRDAEVMGPPVGVGILKHRAEMLEVLARGWGLRRRCQLLLLAVLRLALDFQTWRSLVRQSGLEDSVAIEVVVGLVEQAVRKLAKAEVTTPLSHRLNHSPK